MIDKLLRLRSLRRLWLVVFAGVCLQVLTQCAGAAGCPAPPVYASYFVAPKVCSVTTNCLSSPPECAELVSGAYLCDTTAHQCIYRRRAVNSCRCVEKEARPCPLPDGTVGYQTCSRLGASTTNWTACAAL